jgi:pimeloyl-ACP methyl ester carboxylesterase
VPLALTRPSRTAWVGLAATTAALVGARRAERALLARWDRPVARLPEARTAESLPHRVPTDDGAVLRVLEWGQGRPVVLVHGITARCEDWLPVVPYLVRAGHRVVAVDLRGHGASTLGSDGCGTARLVEDLVQVLEALDLRDAVLAGHSLGGYVALALAGTHPTLANERLATIVVLGAPHSARGLRELATLATVAAPWTPRLQRSEPHGALLMGLVAFGADPRRTSVDDVRHRWATCPGATRRCFARHLVGESITALLGRIEVPVVVARGTRDHVVTARRNAALLRRLPRGRAATFDGAGHALLVEQPAAVAATIVEAARRHT